MILSLITTTTINTLPFNQQLTLTLINAIVPITGSVIMLIFIWRFMPRLMDIVLKRIGKYERDYNCRCARCQAELRTKRGIREWKRHFKRNNRFNKGDWK